MSVRKEIRSAVEQNDLARVEELVAENARALRHVVGMTYQTDPKIRATAARGVALASRHHPKLVQNVIRRFVWAMNDESGTNAETAPEVLRAIAEERPELLLPMVPDLIRLAGDKVLQEGLAATLRIVRDRCPGELNKKLTDALNEHLARFGGSRKGVLRA